MKRLQALAFLVLFAACRPSASHLNSEKVENVLLGLNDVSILLPYNTYPELFQKAPVITDVLPEAWIRAIDTALEDDQPGQDEKTVFFRMNTTKIFEYRLTSLRVDPFRQEFRLVWQKTDGSGSNLRFDDNNIHAIHKLTTTEFADLIVALRSMKKASITDTLPMPLQPNPTIVAEGLNSAYHLGVLDLVQRFARSSNLIELAFLADTNQSGHWPMLKLAIRDGKTQVLAIPGTELNDDGQAFRVQRMDGRSDLDDPLPLGNTEHNLFRAAAPAERYTNAFALENPRLHNADNLDCANCHRANLEKEAIKARHENLPVPTQQFTSDHWNLQALYGIGDEQSLQMFSYFLRKVKIAPRVINESAEVADQLNQLD